MENALHVSYNSYLAKHKTLLLIVSFSRPRILLNYRQQNIHSIVHYYKPILKYIE